GDRVVRAGAAVARLEPTASDALGTNDHVRRYVEGVRVEGLRGIGGGAGRGVEIQVGLREQVRDPTGGDEHPSAPRLTECPRISGCGGDVVDALYLCPWSPGR